MNEQQKAQLRHEFRLIVHESEGQAYENLFVSIMQRANPDFIPIKAHGSFGDRKNDGYDPKRGKYYQVYAPEDFRKNQFQAIKKIKDDFQGLKKYWDSFCPIQEYYFVVNDKFKDVYPVVEEKLAWIKKRYSLQQCSPLLAAHLEQILFNLPDDIIVSLVGYSRIIEHTNELSHIPTFVSPAATLDVTPHIKGVVELPTLYQMEAIISQAIQEVCGRPVTNSDLQVYIPILRKYGVSRGLIIIKRSLFAGWRTR